MEAREMYVRATGMHFYTGKSKGRQVVYQTWGYFVYDKDSNEIVFFSDSKRNISPVFVGDANEFSFSDEKVRAFNREYADLYEIEHICSYSEIEPFDLLDYFSDRNRYHHKDMTDKPYKVHIPKRTA